MKIYLKYILLILLPVFIKSAEDLGLKKSSVKKRVREEGVEIESNKKQLEVENLFKNISIESAAKLLPTLNKKKVFIAIKSLIDRIDPEFKSDNYTDERRTLFNLACKHRYNELITVLMTLFNDENWLFFVIRKILESANKANLFHAKNFIDMLLSNLPIDIIKNYSPREFVTNIKCDAYFLYASELNITTHRFILNKYQKLKKYLLMFKKYGYNPINFAYMPYVSIATAVKEKQDLLRLNFGEEVDNNHLLEFFTDIYDLMPKEIIDYPQDLSCKSFYDNIREAILNLFMINDYAGLSSWETDYAQINAKRDLALGNIIGEKESFIYIFFTKDEIISLLIDKIPNEDLIIEWLSSVKSLRNLKDLDGKNLLYYAIIYNNYELVKYLLRENSNSITHLDDNCEDAFNILVDRPELFNKLLTDLYKK